MPMPKWIRELLRDTGESHDVTDREKKYEVEITGCGLCQTDVPCEFQIPVDEDVPED